MQRISIIDSSISVKQKFVGMEGHMEPLRWELRMSLPGLRNPVGFRVYGLGLLQSGKHHAVVAPWYL